MRAKPSRNIAGDRAQRRLMDLLETGLKTVVAPSSARGARLLPGHHAHDAWECFWIYGKPLRCEVAGQAPMTVPPETLLLIPPDCVHMQVENTNAVSDLALLVIALPGNEVPNGCLSDATGNGVRDEVRLSAEAGAAWSSLLGEPPATVLARAVAALERGDASAQFGTALVRLALSALGAAVSSVAVEPACGGAELRVQAILRERFYDPDLSLDRVAKEVGLSPAHLAAQFKKTTGRPLWQTLIGIRLDRAKALLQGRRYSVKEIAALTGWSNQLYFSSAFRRRMGVSPIVWREASRKRLA